MPQTLSPNKRMVQAAYALASSRQMACRDDITLLVQVVGSLDHLQAPWVVQLGAGSGTMSLAILGARSDVNLVSVDENAENLGWELRALLNAGYSLTRRTSGRLWQHLSDSRFAAVAWWPSEIGNIDLLVVDADHSYRGVKRDLLAWLPHVRDGGIIFVHDWDGRTAPRQYPGVRTACDEILGQPFQSFGWSAVFLKT